MSYGYDLGWKADHNLGLEEIDAQHRYFLRTLELLEQAHRNQVPTHHILEQFLELERFLKLHFLYEQQLMILYNYPDKTQHIEQHQKFIETLGDFTLVFEKSNQKQFAELIKMGMKWFVEHTTNDDILLVSHVIKHRQEFALKANPQVILKPEAQPI